MHDDYDLRQEQLNKASIMSSKKFLESLMEMFRKHVVGRTQIDRKSDRCAHAYMNGHTHTYTHTNRDFIQVSK